MLKRSKSFLIILLSTTAIWFSGDLLARETGNNQTPSLRPGEEEELGSSQEAHFQPLNSLVEEALRVNPSIQAARQEWQAAIKRPSQDSSLPNPELTFGSMSTGNLLPYSTIGGGPLSWASFMFSQKIPWPGKLELKGEVARTEAEQASLRYRAVTLDVIQNLKEAYFELNYVTQSKAILKRYLALLNKFSRIAETRYSVGEGIQADVLRSQVEVSLLHERLEVIEAQSERAQARINRLVNRSPDDSLPTTPPVPDRAIKELPFSLERLYLMARKQNPEIDVRRLEIQKASLKVDLSRKNMWPDFNLSTAYMMRTGGFDNMYEYQAGLEIPLYFWRKERLGIEENVEVLEKARHDYRNRLQDVTFQIKDSYISARTSYRLTQLYKEGVIPQATASLDSALSAYEVGTLDFLDVVENALTILNYELQYQEEIKGYFQNLARLEGLLDVVLVR